jgi:asparagine synthase (glutamine-hydrolysing)
MAERMVHGKGQGFDVIVDTGQGVGVSWLRQVDSENETIPAWNDRHDLCALLCGEHFPDMADREDTNPATSLLHGYEKEGTKFLERLNGWFSGVVIDLRQRKIILFNDRYGLGRLYFHHNATGFFFASQAKALLQMLPDSRRIDPKGLGEWFACGCVLQDRTLFADISLLPAGSAWVFSPDGTLAKKTYFDPASWSSQQPLRQREYYERLRETFPRVLERYLAGNQLIGMSLTGGLDARMIMAWSSKAPGELPCYTFNGPVRDCADVKIARLVARACGQPHCTIQLGDEFLAAFPELAEQTVRITDGAMDVSGAAELYANSRARQISPVRLTGNYGSEILRSNIAFRPPRLSERLFDRGFEGHVQRAVCTYAEEVKGNPRSFIAFKQVPWYHFGRFAVEQSQLSVRSPFLDNDLVALAFRAPLEKEGDLSSSVQLIADGKPELGRIPTDRGITYPVNKAPNRLRRAVEEFLAKAEYAYDYGMPQWLARIDHALEPLRLERLFLGRQKFCHFRIWYRDALAPYVKEMLLDSRTLSRPYLNARGVESMITGHLSGSRNFTTEIHKLLSMELLHRQLLEQ